MADLRSIIENFNETFNKDEWQRAPELISDDAISTAPGAPPMGRDEFIQFAKKFKDAAPDSKIVIDKYYEDGDKAIVEGRFIGTHTAPLVSPQARSRPKGRSLNFHMPTSSRSRMERSPNTPLITTT